MSTDAFNTAVQADSSGKMLLHNALYVNQNVTLVFTLLHEGQPCVFGTRTFPLHTDFEDEDDLIEELWLKDDLIALV